MSKDHETPEHNVQIMLLDRILGKGAFDEIDALFWMLLLHTCSIKMRHEEAANCTLVLPPLTQRDASGVIAGLWRDRNDSMRTNYVYWYRRYTEDVAAETLDCLTGADRERFTRLKDVLMADASVISVDEDF